MLRRKVTAHGALERISLVLWITVLTPAWAENFDEDSKLLKEIFSK